MSLNRNLSKLLLAAAVALGTLSFSPAAFAATGSHPASTAKAPVAKERLLKPASRFQTQTFGPGYTGGNRHSVQASGPEYDGG